MKFWFYIFRGLLLIATGRHRQFVANSETPAVQNAPVRICETIGVNGPAQAPVEVEACAYFVANLEIPALQSSIPNGPYQELACETIKYTNDPAQVTAAACLTMRELVQGIQHECTGSMSGGGEPGCKDETRSAEKEAAKPRFGGSASSKGPRWRDGSIEKPVGTRTNAGGWSEAYYTVEQQRRLGVDETGKPIQEEGEAEDHSKVEEGKDDRFQRAKADSEVTRRYPGIPREINLVGFDSWPHDRRGQMVVPPCTNGVYYLTSEMIDEEPVWRRRDKCDGRGDGRSWIARASWRNRPDWSSFGEDGRKHVVPMVFGVLVDGGGFARHMDFWLNRYARIHHQVSRWKQ